MDLQSTTLPLCYLTICRLVLGKEGFEPPMNASTDLQSAAFSHSATFPVYLSYCFCTSTPVHHNHTLRTHNKHICFYLYHWYICSCIICCTLHYMLHSALHAAFCIRVHNDQIAQCTPYAFIWCVPQYVYAD